MAKAVGIIAEFNPFHEGHSYLIQQAKEKYEADFAVIIMNGSFVQQGNPAVFSKYTRTLAALEGGADLIFELPVRFGISSAGDFALGGIMALDSLGVVSDLVFGSECGKLAPLDEIADLFFHETEEFQKALDKGLRTGLSYPHARANALKETSDIDTKLLKEPNNILGIEYCLALKKLQSPIRPHTIHRKGMGYHDTDSPDPKDSGFFFPSASSLRRGIYTDKSPHLQLDDFSAALGYVLLSYPDLTRFKDISLDLAARIRHYILSFTTVTKLVEECRTRTFTDGRIRRALLQCLLGITGEPDGASCLPYLRLLGMKKEAGTLLSQIKTGSCKILSRLAPDSRELSKEALAMLQQDIFAANLYRQTWCRKYHVRLLNEFQHAPIVL